MNGLLIADFRRVLKDKLLLIMGILAAVFAITTPLLYAAIFHGLAAIDDEMTAAMLSGFTSAKAQFFGSFSMGNNLGLIAPVLLAIALCKDFSYGTVRNKIIAGKSRQNIFLSLFITCAAFLIGIMLLYAFLTLGVSLIFFDYQAEPFTLPDLWYFLLSLGFEILVLLDVAAMLSWLCAFTKNTGLVVVLYVAIVMILAVGGSVSQMVNLVPGGSAVNQEFLSVLHFFDRVNVCNSAMFIGTGAEYTATDIMYLTIAPIAETLIFLGLGLYKFKRKDLK